MKSGREFVQGYNAQAVVDDEVQVIAASNRSAGSGT